MKTSEEEDPVLDSFLDATGHPLAVGSLSMMLKLLNLAIRELSLLRENDGVDRMCLISRFLRILTGFGDCIVPLVDVGSSNCSSGR